MDLADQKCVPCRGGVPAMDRSRANELLRELGAGWRLNDEGHLEREYRVHNFREAMDLANKGGRRRRAGRPPPGPPHRLGNVRGRDLDP